MDRFSPSKTVKKNCREKKEKYQITPQEKVQTDAPGKASFSKMLKFDLFQILKIEPFCHFWVSIKNNLFLSYKLTKNKNNFGDSTKDRVMFHRSFVVVFKIFCSLFSAQYPSEVTPLNESF
jgi:hypothetical protein